MDAAGCFVTCRVVSPELVWPWQLVPLTLRMDNLKQAPAGPLPAFLTLYSLQETIPFLASEPGLCRCRGSELEAVAAHTALVPGKLWRWAGAGGVLA